MSDIKFDCESCGESIVIDDSQFEPTNETEARIYGQELGCPHCGKKTRALKLKPIFGKTPIVPDPSWQGIPDRPKPMTRSIRRRAENLAIFSAWFIGLGIAGMVITVFVAGNENMQDEVARDWIIGSVFSGSLAAIGLWLYLVAQIVHIRANTHKD